MHGSLISEGRSPRHLLWGRATGAASVAHPVQDLPHQFARIGVLVFEGSLEHALDRAVLATHLPQNGLGPKAGFFIGVFQEVQEGGRGMRTHLHKYLGCEVTVLLFVPEKGNQERKAFRGHTLENTCRPEGSIWLALHLQESLKKHGN